VHACVRACVRACVCVRARAHMRACVRAFVCVLFVHGLMIVCIAWTPVDVVAHALFVGRVARAHVLACSGLGLSVSTCASLSARERDVFVCLFACTYECARETRELVRPRGACIQAFLGERERLRGRLSGEVIGDSIVGQPPSRGEVGGEVGERFEKGVGSGVSLDGRPSMAPCGGAEAPLLQGGVGGVTRHGVAGGFLGVTGLHRGQAL